MGHVSDTFSFKPGKNGDPPIKEMLKQAQIYAMHHTDMQENPGGRYYNSFEELTKQVFPDREAADEWIQAHCLGDYKDGYVRYMERKDNGKSQKARERTRKLYDERRDYMQRAFEDFAARKSKFIGCPTCGSKLNNEYLTGNLRRGGLTPKCPLCHTELWSETVKTRLKRMDQKIKEAEKTEREAKETTGQLMYLAKYEVHC